MVQHLVQVTLTSLPVSLYQLHLLVALIAIIPITYITQVVPLVQKIPVQVHVILTIHFIPLPLTGVLIAYHRGVLAWTSVQKVGGYPLWQNIAPYIVATIPAPS